MTECYRCGQEGHTRSRCPQQEPPPPAAPGRAAELTRRVPADPAIARTWAAVIRDTLGWGPPEERDTRG